MKRERDTHERPRAELGGRLSVPQGVRLDLKIANKELGLAVSAPDAKSMREHVVLARRLLVQVMAKLERAK